MFKYKVERILDTVDGQLIKGNKNDILKGVSTDTRKLSDEDIFVALKGEKFDAHDLIEKKIKKNIKAVIVDKLVETNCDIIIKVDDTYKALQQMAKFHRKNHKDVKVIGITGSSGKTSTKDILYQILNKNYNIKKNEGNFNNQIGVPLTLFKMDGNEDFFIVEMGMSQTGEIKLLAEIADPQIGLITNVGPAHLEFFDSIEEIALAKGELIEALGKDDLAVLNYDNSYTKIINKLSDEQTEIQYFGFNPSADFYIKEFKYQKSGMNFKLCSNSFEAEMNTNLFGQHNLYNILAAVTVASNLNVNWQLIKEVVKDLKLSELRSEIKTVNEIKIIMDCYNANPASMGNALKVLTNIKANRKIAVLGDMLELGDNKEEIHSKLGQNISEMKIDFLLTIGKLAKYISTAALDFGFKKDNVKHFAEKNDLIKYLKEIAQIDDLILLKGSRGMKMEDIYYKFLKYKG